MINGWQRKEHTTKGPDPTVVVAWSKDTMKIIMEFQQVYTTSRDEEVARFGTTAAVLGEELHKALEDLYMAQVGNALNQDGFDADRRIYGGQ